MFYDILVWYYFVHPFVFCEQESVTTQGTSLIKKVMPLSVSVSVSLSICGVGFSWCFCKFACFQSMITTRLSIWLPIWWYIMIRPNYNWRPWVIKRLRRFEQVLLSVMKKRGKYGFIFTHLTFYHLPCNAPILSHKALSFIVQLIRLWLST